MALRVGGTLYIASKTARLAGSDLIQLLHDKAITTALPACCTSGYLHKNFQYFTISGGEACSSEIVAMGCWSSVHAYGPTEVTIWATVAQLSDSSAKPRLGARLPIQ